MIVHEAGKWNLYSKDGKKKLGSHPSREKAVQQEQAVKAHEASEHDAEWGTEGFGGESAPEYESNSVTKAAEPGYGEKDAGYEVEEPADAEESGHESDDEDHEADVKHDPKGFEHEEEDRHRTSKKGLRRKLSKY